MQESLRIDYRSSDGAVIGYCLLTLFCCIAVLGLPLLPQYTLLLLFLLACLFLFSLYRLLRDGVDVLRFDGERWFATLERGEVIVIDQYNWVTPLFVVMQARLGGEKRYRLWFFCRDNCSESELRQLSRVLLAVRHF